MQTANLYSAFSSIQGEGLWVGYPQVFVRFGGCNLKCRYCDTREAQRPARRARFEITPFTRKFRRFNNPVPINDLNKQIIKAFNVSPGLHSIALTGGEPLLQADFLAAWLPRIKQSGIRVLLETNGTLPAALGQVIKWVDIISMDIKTPSTTGLPVRACLPRWGGRQAHTQTGAIIDWDKTQRFLKIAARKDVYIKVLIGKTVNTAELKRIQRLISAVNKNITVVLQPITPRAKTRSPMRSRPLIRAYHLLSRRLADVRIIPQVHKLTGWL